MIGVYEPQVAAFLGIISVIPAAVMIVADIVAPGIASWGDVAAAGVVFSLFVWLLTVHIPSREKASEARLDARDAANEKRLDKIQADFVQALQMRDETSRLNAASGHSAMRDIIASDAEKMEAFERLNESIKNMCETLEIQKRHRNE